MGKQGHISGTLPEISPCATELWASSFPAQAVNSALSHLYPNPAGPWVGCAHPGHWEHPWHSRHGHKAQSLHWSFGKQLLGHVLEAPPELALRGDSVQGHLPCRSQGVRERGSCSSPLPNTPTRHGWGSWSRTRVPLSPHRPGHSTAALGDCSGSTSSSRPPHSPPLNPEFLRLEKPSRVTESSL